ncbi:MAG: glycosyltransferase family 4 protein [Isosphaeraceae bacterium]
MSTDLTLKPPRRDAPLRAEAGRLKRVLYVLKLDPAGKFGSIEEQTLTFARLFREHGSLFLPVYIRPLDAESASQYAREGLTVEALDLSRFRLRVLWRLLHLVRQNRIDVVHWSFYHPLFNGYLWALSALMPWVEHYFTDHISRPAARLQPVVGGLKSRLKRVLAARYRKILCISDFVLAQVRESSSPHAERTHYFINTDRFRPDRSVRLEVRRALGVAEEFVAVTVAYLIKEKGIDVAVKAMAELPDDIVLWIVGDGPEQANLQALVQDLGLGRRVRFLGAKRRVEPLLQAADCALCPSVWAEAVGLVNLEALSCGLPDIASRIGGIPEFVAENRNGFLFTPGNHHELAEQIRRLYNDSELRHQMGEQARSIAVAHYTGHRLMESHLRVYREAAT